VYTRSKPKQGARTFTSIHVHSVWDFSIDFFDFFLQKMAVVIETTLGDITVDLFIKERPKSKF
jgi:hypothetical protein